MPRGLRLALAWIALLGTAPFALGDDPPPLKPPAFDEFVVIPLRVHILTSKNQPDLNCALTDADIERVLGKINGIWQQAGVHWVLESLIREPAAKQARFKAALGAAEDDGEKLGAIWMLVPEASMADEGVDVYYIHQFPVNGIYIGYRVVFVQETAALRPVPGGIDEPIPRVTAHELGHALGLPHRQARTNLLASGTTGTTLNDAEVAHARERARAIPGAMTVPDLRKKAEKASTKGETAEARRLWTWLAEIPGEGAAEARKRLEALSAVESKPTTP